MNCETIDTTKYVGIDIGKRVCAVCVMDRDGNVLEQTKYKNTRESAGKLAKTILSKYGTCSAVCESTSKMWMKTYEVFEEYRIPIVLCKKIRYFSVPDGSRISCRRDRFGLHFCVAADSLPNAMSGAGPLRIGLGMLQLNLT